MTFTLVLVLATGVFLWFTPTKEDFRDDNPFWNGGQELVAALEIPTLASLSEMPSLFQDSTLILIPYNSFTEADLERIRIFVIRGGILFLADDFGWGNQVLEYLGLQTRFAGPLMLDPLHHFKNKRLPEVRDVKEDFLTRGIEHLTLNHPTALIAVDSTNMLVSSSPFSFLDYNGNGKADESEPTGSLVVMSREVLGDGQVVLLSDPSVFINSMLDFEGNRQLLENITLANQPGLYISQSHLEISSLRKTKELMRTVREKVLSTSWFLALAILVLAITLAPVWYRGREQKGHNVSERRDN